MLENFTMPRTGDRPLTFAGELIASADGRRQGGKEANRWHELAVYRTARGNWIAAISYRTCWQGELDESLAQHVTVAPSDPPLKEQEIGEAIAAFFRHYDPTGAVKGYPDGAAYSEKQHKLLADIRFRYQSLVSELLANFAEEVA